MAETAIIIPVPAAEAATRPFRALWDADNVRDRVPPHITLLYPFRDSAALDDGALIRLAALFAATSAFDLRLAGLCGFPDGTLFLWPEDPRPLEQLTARVAAAFPDTPPYGGRFADTLPHLTIGHVPADEIADACSAIETWWRRAALPLTTRIEHASLLVREFNGCYRTARDWPFAPAG